MIIIIIIIIITVKIIIIKKMWGIKTTTVPVIIGAFGLVKKGTENYIQPYPLRQYQSNRAISE